MCLAATRRGGAASVDSDTWLQDLARIGRLDPSPEDEAAARRAHTPMDGVPKRFDGGVVVTQSCGEREMESTCGAEIHFDEAGERGPQRLVTRSPSPLLPHRDADFATSNQDLGPSAVELWTDHAGEWFVTRDRVRVDAANEHRHLRLVDVSGGFAIPDLAFEVAALGLVAALIALSRGARWTRFSLELARGMSGEITADGWLETPKREAVRVKPRGEAVVAGPVVVLARGARAPSYRRAPIDDVNYAVGDKATLVEGARANAAALSTTAIAVALVAAAPLAAAALVLG